MKTTQTLSLAFLLAMLTNPFHLMAAPTYIYVAPTIEQPVGSAYEKTMTATIEKLYRAGSVEELQAAVNQFETIARKETSEWLPLYYASLGYVWMATRAEQKATKEGYLNQGQALLEKATALKGGESELVALQGFLYMIQLSTDPATLGPVLSGKATAILEQAHQMNPENPRATLLLSQMKIGTARYFGASTDEGCQLTQQSLAQFGKENPANPLMPRWGGEMAKSVLEQCGK
jgi:hypothetical protein